MFLSEQECVNPLSSAHFKNALTPALVPPVNVSLPCPQVHMMHKSVMAYLTSPGPLQALGYDPAEGQEMLALHCHHSTR
jgi:hypothetical protein